MLLIPRADSSNRADTKGGIQASVDAWQPTALQQLAKKTLLRTLSRLEEGSITLVDGAGEVRVGSATAPDLIHATIYVREPRFYTDLAFEGSIGAGRAYSEGLWTCDDLTLVVRLLVRNRAVLDECERGLARLSGSVRRLLQGLRRNTRAGSRDNIAAHYDLSNEFFGMFLDETMT